MSQDLMEDQMSSITINLNLNENDQRESYLLWPKRTLNRLNSIQIRQVGHEKGLLKFMKDSSVM